MPCNTLLAPFPWPRLTQTLGNHPFVMASFAIFGACFPVFLYNETRAERPIMPLHLIRKSPHMNLIFSNFIAAFLTHAMIFNMYVQIPGC